MIGGAAHRDRPGPGAIDAGGQFPAEILSIPAAVPEYRSSGLLRGDGGAQLL